MPKDDTVFALADSIDPDRAKELRQETPEGEAKALAVLLGVAFPPLAPTREWQHQALAEVSRLRMRAPFVPEELDVDVQSLLRDGVEFEAALRHGVWKQKARIALRELMPRTIGGPDVDQTAKDLSLLAEVGIELALSEAEKHAVKEFGEPMRTDGKRSTSVVFGMGKLGGLELNAGSDIDLIFCYDTDDGVGDFSLHRFWTEVVRNTVNSLDNITEDGNVWRVDLRLRPEGESGPVTNSMAATERYYETWGRQWERAVLLRCRVVGGDRELGKLFMTEVFQPFVFRRNSSRSVGSTMMDMVKRSRAELCTDPDRDLKLGYGGIREAEFFVQALQLVWGGREPSIRVPGMLEALGHLRSRGFATEKEHKEITEAYLMLRRVEHRIQWMTGVQTHLLPEAPDMRLRLARSLWFEDVEGLMSALEVARRHVSAHFATLAPDRPEVESPYGRQLAKLENEDPEVTTELGELFGDEDIGEHLLALARSMDGPLGSRVRERYAGFGASLLDAISGCADPGQAARYLRSFFARFGSNSGYVDALAQNPAILHRFVNVLGARCFVGDAIVNRPDLADALLFGGPEVGWPEPARIVSERIAAFEQKRSPDPDEARDEFIAALRRAKGEVMVAVAVADLAGDADTAKVTRCLSALADDILRRTVRYETGDDAEGLCVIAVGKLGGGELGYGSDLDVLFVYEPSLAPAGSYAAEHFSQCAQRIIRSISAMHWAGPGYELDTRLRPSGSQGMLVTALESFARYHGVRLRRSSAPDIDAPHRVSSGAAWERQALLRARYCAGDREVGTEVIRICHVAAYEHGAPPVEEMHHLRMRMERELARETAGRYDLKMGRGGLLDVEFAAQWLQMSHGSDPRVRTTDTAGALKRLSRVGAISERDVQELTEHYAFLRGLEQRIRVLNGDGATVLDERHSDLDKLARRVRLNPVAGVTPRELLLSTYRMVTDAVRATYLRVLRLPPESLPPGGVSVPPLG